MLVLVLLLAGNRKQKEAVGWYNTIANSLCHASSILHYSAAAAAVPALWAFRCKMSQKYGLPDINFVIHELDLSVLFAFNIVWRGLCPVIHTIDPLVSSYIWPHDMCYFHFVMESVIVEYNCSITNSIFVMGLGLLLSLWKLLLCCWILRDVWFIWLFSPRSLKTTTYDKFFN